MPTISSSVQQDLVSNSYLHSNPFNFTNAVAIASFGSIFNLDNQRILTKLKMEAALSELERKEKNFYKEMGVSNYYDFNVKFHSILDEYLCLKELHSEEFANSIGSSFLKKVEFLANQLGAEVNIEEKDLAKLEKQILDMINNNYILQPGEQKLKVAFSSKKGKKSVNRLNKTMTVRLDSLFTKESLKKAQEQGIIPKDLDSAARDFLKSKGYEITPELSSALTDAFNSMKDKINLKVTDQSNLLGIVGEFQAQVIFNTVLGKLSKKSEMRKALYVGADKDVSTGKQSSIDFLVGQYGIQVKNTKRDLVAAAFSNKNYHTVNLVRDVALNTYAERLDDGALYKYLVENVLFLSKYGLDKKGKPSPLDTSQERVSKIIDFIGSILNENSLTLLHAQEGDIIIKAAEKETSVRNYGNVFFFLGGTSLVPVSVMLRGVMEQMEEDFKKLESSEGAGSFVSNGKVGIENHELGKVQILFQENPISPEVFQEKKRDAIRPLDKGGEYKYPPEIMGIGSNTGRSLGDSLKVRISYNYNLTNLLNIVGRQF